MVIYIDNEIIKRQQLLRKVDKNVEQSNKKICPFCKKPVDESKLRRHIDREEYKKTGMCQDCQDTTF